MIFPKVKSESTLRVGESTRIFFSYVVTPDENGITLLEVDPDGSGTFYEVTEDSYLDWVFDTAGTFTGELRATSGLATVIVKAFDTVVLSETDDIAFANDEDLRCHEPELDCYLPDGKCDWIKMHRCVCEKIIKWIAESGLYKKYDCCELSSCLCSNSLPDRYKKEDLRGNEDVNCWATYEALMMIFEGQSNAVDDIFAEKAGRYRELRDKARNRARIELDTDGDGKVDCRLEIGCTRIIL